MEINNVVVSLYLQNHPLIQESNIEKRKNYLGFLMYYSDSEYRFSDAALALYRRFFLGGENVPVEPRASLSGLFEYRFCLWMDVWFINALRDAAKARVLHLRMLRKSGLSDRYHGRLDRLYQRLYPREKTTQERSRSIFGLRYRPAPAKSPDRFPAVEDLIAVWECNRKWMEQSPIKIVFTANMSAGKSTLINALIGVKANKSQSMACTAKLHYIYNKPINDGFFAEDDHVLNLDADNNTLMTDDEENTSNNISVGIYFRFVSGLSVPCCFLDTPGVNNSLDVLHGEITESAIKTGDYDKLVYIVNADGGIATDDEHRYLTFLSENAVQKPVIIAVNKIDRFRSEEDDIRSSLKKIHQDIVQYRFRDSVVCPVSAYAGFLAKMVYYGLEMNENQQDEYDLYCLMFKKKEYCLLPYYPEDVRKICGEITESEHDPMRKRALQLLCNCGVLPLEFIIKKEI